jgi:hypothetical protein
MKLMKNVRKMVQDQKLVEAHLTAYFSSGQLPPAVFAKENGPWAHVPSSRLKCTMLDYVRRIILCWFGMKCSFYAKARSHFVICLASCLSNECLPLPDTWAVYAEMPQWMFTQDSPCACLGTLSDVQFVDSYLGNFKRCLVLFTQSNALPLQMDKLQQACMELSRTAQVYAARMVNARINSNHLKHLMTAPSWDPPFMFSLAVGSKSSVGSSRQGTAQPADLSGPNVPPLMKQKAVTLLLQILEDASIVLQCLSRKQSPAHRSTVAITTMFKWSDFLLPLRKSASCRQIVNNKLHQDFAVTCAGLFSMQIFRFILFNSKAFCRFERAGYK